MTNLARRLRGMPSCTPLVPFLLILLLLAISPAAAAPDGDAEAAGPADAKAEAGADADAAADGVLDPDYEEEVTVTATRTEKSTFEVPNPVSIVTARRLDELNARSLGDVFRDMVGLDVSGVGANQPRPVIRGQRGQRVLLLENGLRLNNFRRQSDFGEIPSLVDPESLERVEVVRGPGSVLYGSDAIGGVVNLITEVPQSADGEIHGHLGYMFDSSGSAGRATAGLSGQLGLLSWSIEGAYRDADDYDAPSGRYGDIVLADDTPVVDTGVQDDSLRAAFSLPFGKRHSATLAIERYEAQDAGFGFVEPSAFNPGGERVRILYPDQEFEQVMLTHRAKELAGPLADRWQTSAFLRSNERILAFDLIVPFFPGAGLAIETENFTDVDSWGLRTEATKAIAGRHALTYGLDFHRDSSFNTDFSRTTVFGFGPPDIDEDTTPTLPNSTYESVGIFVQDDVRLSDRVDLIVGARYQATEARTKSTVGLESEPLFKSDDDALVGAANLIVRASDDWRLVANVGSAFRSPNLIERFFHGEAAEGFGFQTRNPFLEPETSFNVDLGTKFRRGRVRFEAFVFRNEIEDGIRIAATGNMVGPFPEFQNVNVDKLRYEGVEAAFNVALPRGFSLGFDFTRILSEDVTNVTLPISDSYSSKLNLNARYTRPDGRFWVEYRLRHNGEQDDVGAFNSMVGAVFPSFTVHRLSGSVRLYEGRGMTHELGIVADNLTDELYAEFTNASFFRPEPGRSVRADWSLRF